MVIQICLLFQVSNWMHNVYTPTQYVSVVVFLMFMTFIAAIYAFQARVPAVSKLPSTSKTWWLTPPLLPSHSGEPQSLGYKLPMLLVPTRQLTYWQYKIMWAYSNSKDRIAKPQLGYQLWNHLPMYYRQEVMNSWYIYNVGHNCGFALSFLSEHC